MCSRDGHIICLLVFLGVFVTGSVLVSCSAQKKLKEIKAVEMAASLQLPKDRQADFRDISSIDSTKKKADTLKIVNMDGQQMLIMKAVKDESGELVATQELDAAVVTARFRNVAERHGKIDLEFQVIVPAKMQDGKWQLRFTPDMFIMEDSTRLDPVIITGNSYRKAQLKGYQQYERFVNSIITDSTKFINLAALEIFLQRNIPALFAFKEDSTEVSDERFNAVFGVTEKEAVDHYTDKLRKKWNENKKARKSKMFRKYVKMPIVTEGIRLDTVMQSPFGEFIYNYVQTINTRPKLRKADIVLSGAIFEQDKQIYSVPRTEPLTFYISSLSAFVDGTERYLTKVIERKAEANAAWNIDFAVGKFEVDENFGSNAGEMENIRKNLRALLVNEVFDLDSISISASASPEGSLAANNALSAKRAKSDSDYFNRFTKSIQDSLKREAGMSIIVGDDMEAGGMTSAFTTQEIRFKSRSAGENWFLLDNIVANDTLMTDAQKEQYRSLQSIADVDKREMSMKTQAYYPRMKTHLYPMLRTVQFQFALHRRGMVKDTVHTTELDTTYMNGVQAIRDRDYEAAIALLTPYQDYNTAIAYVAMDRNASAMAILKNLEKTAQVNYMLAILYARDGDDQNAVQHYLNSCQQDASYINRGNLDPEIAALIRKYELNKQPEDDLDAIWGL